MFDYVIGFFSSLLNMSSFMHHDDDLDSKQSSEKLIKNEDKDEETKEDVIEEKKEDVIEEKKTSETFQFIEINDDDAFDFFITKF